MSRYYETEIETKGIEEKKLRKLLKEAGVKINDMTTMDRKKKHFITSANITLCGGEDEADVHKRIKAKLKTNNLIIRWSCLDFQEWDTETGVKE